MALSFKNPFRRKPIPHPDGLDSTYYTQAYIFTGGSESLAYHNDRPHPLLTTFGGFLPAQQLRLTNRQTVYQYSGAPLQPVLPGIVAGQMYGAPLTQQGQLGGSANNNLLNNSLFGGVQS